MNNGNLYFFAVAKYVPDLIRNEPKNIGIILFNESGQHYKAKFSRNYKNKLGAHTIISDKELIGNYYNYFLEFKPSKKEEIISSINNTNGKFQFSDIRSGVTNDFEMELDYLYKTFIEDADLHIKRHRLKTTIKNELTKLNIIGKNKFLADQEIKSGNITHKVDFFYQKDKLYAIEAVDLSVTDKRTNTIESAFKFDNLLRKFGKRKLKTISVIQKPMVADQQDGDLLKILTELSKVYNYSNGQRQVFLDDVNKIIK